MVKNSKFVFFGGAFGVILVAAALAGATGVSTNYVVHLEQPETGPSSELGAGIYQQLACDDVAYDTHAVEVVMQGNAGLFSGTDLVLEIGRASGSGDWNARNKRTLARGTATLSGSDKTPVRFLLDSPVSADSICQKSDDMPYLHVQAATGGETTRVYGSASATAYRSALFGCVLENGLPCLGDVRDVAFALYTVPNNAPVVTTTGPFTVAEHEELTFTLQATDVDGDTVTWGSSNMPDGASLDSVTGVFAWTPAPGQAGGYKIIFTATDDGGPVQESDSVTLLIMVTDVVTPTDTVMVLLETTQALVVDEALRSQYESTATKVAGFLAKEQTRPAQSQVDGMLRKLEQDVAKGTITQEVYDLLYPVADRLRAELEEVQY